MDRKLEKKTKFLKNVFLFLGASFVPRVISFFMLPLYTNCLTAEQYGNIDLITSTVQLLLPVLTLQVQDAVMVFVMGKNEDPSKVLSISLGIVLGGFILLLLGTMAILILGWIALDWSYIAFFLAHYLIGALTNVINYFMRATEKVENITIASLITCVVTVGVNILFLLVFRWGVNGYLLANILGHLISLIYSCVTAQIDRNLVPCFSDGKLIKQIVLFSIPLVVSSIAWWVNNSLDKYILTFFCGAASTGLLSIAYKIPTIVSVLGATISKAFAISVLQNFSGEDEDGFVGNSYRIISLFVVLIASGLMLLNIPVARILFQKEFFAAWQLVPPLLFSAIMNQMSLCCENICFAMGETKKLSQTALLGAGVNTVLNFCMIPHMGAYGAAVATAISFSVVWLMRYIWIKKNMELKNSQVHEFLSYGVLLLQMFFAYWGNQFLGIQLVGCGFLILLNWDQILKFMKYNLRKVIK